MTWPTSGHTGPAAATADRLRGRASVSRRAWPGRNTARSAAAPHVPAEAPTDGEAAQSLARWRVLVALILSLALHRPPGTQLRHHVSSRGRCRACGTVRSTRFEAVHLRGSGQCTVVPEGRCRQGGSATAPRSRVLTVGDVTIARRLAPAAPAWKLARAEALPALGMYSGYSPRAAGAPPVPASARSSPLKLPACSRAPHPSMEGLGQDRQGETAPHRGRFT